MGAKDLTGCAVPDNLQRLNPAELSLKKLLGRGGFATVYAATYASEPVAAKVLQPAECNIDEARMLEYERMFLREAACTASQEHRSIIQCLGVLQLPAAAVNSSALGGKLDQQPMWCMVLELCEPYTTKTLITQGMTDNRRTYTNLQAYTWLTQLASALAHLHSHRPPIIHRDIKQENLLLKKVTRPPPAAAAAAGGGVPAGAQRLPGCGGGTQLEAKLADLGLHVVVEAERSVMLRRRASSLGTRSIHSRLSRRNSTAQPERLTHGAGGGGGAGGTPLLSPHPRLSKCGSSAAAFGGAAVGDDDDTPFLAVSSVAPSGQASSRLPSWSSGTGGGGGGGVPMSRRPLLPSGHSGNRRRRPASAQAVVLSLHTGAAGEAGCGVAGVATAANATAEDISLYGCLGGACATAITAPAGDADSAAAAEPAAERSPFVATSQQTLLVGNVRDEVAGGTAAAGGTMQEASTCRSSDRGTFEFDVTATATGSCRPPPQQQQQQQQATLAAAARGGGPQQQPRAADGQGGTSSRAAAASAADVGTPSWATRPASSSAPPPGSSRGGMPRSLLSIMTGVDGNDASGVVGITSAGGASGGGSRHVAASPAAQLVASADALAMGEAWRPYQRHSPGAGDGRAVHTHQLCAAAGGSPAMQRRPPWPLSPAAAADGGGGGTRPPPALSLPSPTAAAGVPRGGLVAPSMSVCLTEELIDLAEVEEEGDDVEGDEAQPEPAADQQRPAAMAVGSGAGRAADGVGSGGGTAAAAALRSKLIPRPKSAAAAATSSPDRRLPWAGTAVAVCGGSEPGVGGGAMHVRGVGQACASCVGGSSAAGVRAQHCPGAAAAHADVSDRPTSDRTESLSRLLARHPDLMVQPVGPDGSFTSGLRRVHSVLSQFRQSELKQLRQSSLEWVFGLTGRAGSCMYMAPEVFRKLPYNEKADVFSFGVVMYELLSRELLVISYFNTSRGAKLGMHQPEDYAEMVCDGYRPPRPKCLDHTDQAWELIEACWQDDPVQRPDMDTVLVRLRELQREEELHPTDPPPGGLAGCGCVIC